MPNLRFVKTLRATLGFEKMTGVYPLIGRRRIVVTIIYVLSVLGGIDYFNRTNPLTGILASLITSTFMTQFCIIDSRIRGNPLPWSIPWLIFMSWPISVPVYLFYSRGFRGIYKPILYILAYPAASYLGYILMVLFA